MNALQKIRSGITTGNMLLVAEGYEDLTGEKVEATIATGPSTDDIRKYLISILTKGSDPIPEFMDRPIQPKKVKEPKVKKTKSKKESGTLFYSGEGEKIDLPEALQTKNLPPKTEKAVRKPYNDSKFRCVVCSREFGMGLIGKERTDGGSTMRWCTKCCGA